LETRSPLSRAPLTNILLATDFSSGSEKALQYALNLARRFSATLYLVHVVTPDPLHPANSAAARRQIEDAWREGRQLTTRLIVSGDLKDIEDQLFVVRGELWPSLAEMVRDKKIDLIVVGTRGRGGLIKMLLGSTAEAIFRQSPCPVLTVGPASLPPPQDGLTVQRILYATDFTPQSLAGGDFALSLARQYRSHLILLHVIEEKNEGNALRKSSALEDAKTRLRTLVPAGSDLKFEPEFVVGFGTPASRILSVAAEKTPDLIVLGVTQSLPGRRARRWTTASEVAAKSTCPVLTVRAPAS
jgi:nucleotide-binding universal stress UspA family protein